MNDRNKPQLMDSPNPMSPAPQIQAINRTRESVVVARWVEWAGTSQARRKGLMGRSEMPKDHAMYLVPCEAVHTFGMKFPIDIAFLAADGQVLAIHHALKPRRISKFIFRAEGVLELAAGRLLETGTAVGDLIEFQELNSEA